MTAYLENVENFGNFTAVGELTKSRGSVIENYLLLTSRLYYTSV